MTNSTYSPARYDDEVLRFWDQHARRAQAAYAALWFYLDRAHVDASPNGSKNE
ncbi:MAG: hypothetical protein JJU25_14585 [Halomonas sp.]|nr:hypothetical protein [Halomonas sp.]MCC5883845.1 hypothetical protein [Halomonas sp.]